MDVASVLTEKGTKQKKKKSTPGPGLRACPKCKTDPIGPSAALDHGSAAVKSRLTPKGTPSH